jgi:hypothetical protein
MPRRRRIQTPPESKRPIRKLSPSLPATRLLARKRSSDDPNNPFCVGVTSSAPAPTGFFLTSISCFLGFGYCGGSTPQQEYPNTQAPPSKNTDGGGGSTPPPSKPPAPKQQLRPCGTSGFGFGLAAGANGDAAAIAAGASATGTLGAGLFYDGGNGASIQQLRGPFSTLNFNVGYSFAQLQIQYARSGNTWYLQMSPPFAGASVGFSVTTMKTTTATTNTGCQRGGSSCTRHLVLSDLSSSAPG